MNFDFLGNINLWGGGFTGSLLPFLFVLTIVVFFHELGHFLVARWAGVRVRRHQPEVLAVRIASIISTLLPENGSCPVSA